MGGDGEVADRLDADIGGDKQERGGDQLLSATLGGRGAGPPPSKPPQHHDPRRGLNQAVGTKSHQGDGRGHDSGADGHGRLDPMPRQAQSSEKPRSPYELGRRRGYLRRARGHRGQLGTDGHVPTVVASSRSYGDPSPAGSGKSSLPG